MEKATLIGELNLGRDLAEQLKKQLNSHQPCESLIQKIVSSYDKAISMLNFVSSPALRQDSSSGCSRKRAALTPPEILAASKRKKMQKWSQQVRASEGAGVLDDGFSWRKYGQKDILGANFPRAYYRCTHRHVQGCLATKQVQRSDKDVSIFEITYKGRHTCIPSKVPKTVVKLEGVDETLNTDIDIIADGDLCDEEIETLTPNPEKEEDSLVESVGSYPFNFLENFESELFPSFKSEFQQEFEGLDCDMGKEFDWSEYAVIRWTTFLYVRPRLPMSYKNLFGQTDDLRIRGDALGSKRPPPDPPAVEEDVLVMIQTVQNIQTT